MKKIVIIGAGITGLTTAYSLLQRGDYEITLLEKDNVVGGLSKSVGVNGIVTDLGPHRIFSHYPEAEDFMKKIIGNDFMYIPRRSKIFYNNRFIHYPVRTTEILTTFGFLTSFMSFISFLNQKLKNIVAKGDLVSFADYIKIHFGPYLYKLLFEQYAHKAWNIDPSSISVDVARTRVSAGGLGTILKQKIFGESPNNITSVKTLGYVKGGFGNFPKKIAEEIQKRNAKIILSAELQDIDFDSKNPIVTYKHNNSIEKIKSDICISTIPITDLTKIIVNKKPNTDILRFANSMRYINGAFVLLTTNKNRISEESWLYFPEPNLIFNRGYEPKNFDSSLAPKEQSAICLEVTYLNGDEIDQKNDNEIIERVKADFLKTNLVKMEDISGANLTRVKNIYPLYDLDYFNKLNSILSYLSQFENLYTAGRQGLFNHNNTDHCIHMSFMLANSIIEGENPKQWYENIEEFRNFKIID